MQKSLSLFLLFLMPLLASANQRIIAESFLPADFAPSSVTAMTNDGFWAAGTSNGLAVLVRYDASGAVQFVRHPQMENVQSLKIVGTPDGGVVSTDIENVDIFDFGCSLRRYDAAGNLLWTNRLAEAQLIGNFYRTACSNVSVDGSGGVWLFPTGLNAGYLVLVNPDGTQGAQIETGEFNGTQIVGDPQQSAVYLAGATGREDIDPTNTLATVWKITAQGIVWSQSASAADAGSTLADIAMAADGSVWAFGQKPGQLYGMHVAANATPIWSGAFATNVNATQVKVVVRADGGVSTLHWDPSALESQQANSAPEVSKFSSVGSLLWHASTAFSLPPLATASALSIAAAQNGDIVAALTYSGGGQPDTNHYLQQLRLDNTGAPRFMTSRQALAVSSGFELHVLPDDSSLAVTGAYQHLAPNGSALVGPQTAAITTAASLDDNELIAPDGSTYLVVTNATSKSFSVSAYSSAGTQRWHTPIGSNWNNEGLYGSVLVLRSNDICLAGYLDGDEILQCFALADGTPAPKRILTSSLTTSTAATQAVATASGQLVVLYRSSDGAMHHALIDAQGNLLHDITPLASGETWGASSQNSNGDSVIVTSTTSLIKIAADGTRGYTVSTDLAFSSISLAADGSAILSTYSTSAPPQLERVDSNGIRVWQSTMPAGYYNTVRSVRFTANDVYFVLAQNFAYGTPLLNGLVMKLRLSDGATEWSQSVPYVFGQSPRLALDTNASHLFVLSSHDNLTQLRQFGTVDGAQITATSEPCDVDACLLAQAIVATDGTLRLVHDTTDFFTGSAWEITTLQTDVDRIYSDSFGF